MALSSGILVGLLVAAAGALLYAMTRQKKMAVAVVCVGTALAGLTIAVMALAVNSGM